MTDNDNQTDKVDIVEVAAPARSFTEERKTQITKLVAKVGAMLEDAGMCWVLQLLPEEAELREIPIVATCLPPFDATLLMNQGAVGMMLKTLKDKGEARPVVTKPENPDERPEEDVSVGQYL